MREELAKTNDAAQVDKVIQMALDAQQQEMLAERKALLASTKKANEAIDPSDVAGASQLAKMNQLATALGSHLNHPHGMDIDRQRWNASQVTPDTVAEGQRVLLQERERREEAQHLLCEGFRSNSG